MKQKPIGPIIKEIADEQNLKVVKLAALSGKTRQTVYMTFGRSEMTNEEIAEWSNILGVSEEEIFSRWRNEHPSKESNTDSTYLLEHLESLESQFKLLLQQLEVKDKQIEVKDKQLEFKDKQLEKLIDILGKHKDELQMTPESNLRIAA